MGTQIRFPDEVYRKLQDAFGVDFRKKRGNKEPRKQPAKAPITARPLKGPVPIKPGKSPRKRKHPIAPLFKSPTRSPKKHSKPNRIVTIPTDLSENYFAINRNTLSQTRPNRKTRILNPHSSARKKSAERNAEQSQILRKELAELRNLQTNSTPGFNDFDRGAMK